MVGFPTKTSPCREGSATIPPPQSLVMLRERGNAMHRVFYLGLISFALSACTQAELNRRHAFLGKHVGSPPTASISVFPLAVPPSAARQITSLSDRGQAAFINALAEDTNSATQLRGAVATALGTPIAVGRDSRRQNRRLVISVLKENGFEPGDRISDLRLKLTLKDKNTAQILGWNRFETQYETVTLGEISREQSLEREASVTAAPPGVSAITQLAGSIAAREAITEEQNLRQRRVTLGGRVEPDSLTLIMEGVTGIDLVGTASVDVNLAIKKSITEEVHSFSMVDGKPRMLVGVDRRPTNSCPIEAKVSGNYTVRKILSGARTIPEGDDTVEYINTEISSETPVTLATPSAPPVFRLVESANFKGEEIWTKGPSDSRSSQMNIRSNREAVALLNWIYQQVESGETRPSINGWTFRVVDTSEDGDGPLDEERDFLQSDLKKFATVMRPSIKCANRSSKSKTAS